MILDSLEALQSQQCGLEAWGLNPKHYNPKPLTLNHATYTRVAAQGGARTLRPRDQYPELYTVSCSLSSAAEAWRTHPPHTPPRTHVPLSQTLYPT
jgi:hypothetical protein